MHLCSGGQLNTLWSREAVKHHVKLRNKSIAYNKCSLRLEKQLLLSLHLFFSWKKHQTHLYSLWWDEKLIDLNGYSHLISKVILCLGVPGFESAPLLNHGIIIACRKEFVQFPALCCFPCLHDSTESVPLEQGQLHADVTTLHSPDYLSSRRATYWYILKKPPKITEWLKQILVLWPLAHYLLLQGGLQHSSKTTLQCLRAKGSSQRCSLSHLVQGKQLLEKI